MSLNSVSWAENHEDRKREIDGSCRRCWLRVAPCPYPKNLWEERHLSSWGMGNDCVESGGGSGGGSGEAIENIVFSAKEIGGASANQIGRVLVTGIWNENSGVFLVIEIESMTESENESENVLTRQRVGSALG